MKGLQLTVFANTKPNKRHKISINKNLIIMLKTYLRLITVFPPSIFLAKKML